MRIERIRGGYGRFSEGSSLQGHLPADVSIPALTAVFGRPEHRDNDGNGKVTREWRILFGGEVFASIYDYKGRRWSIGGRSPLAVRLVFEALGLTDPKDWRGNPC